MSETEAEVIDDASIGGEAEATTEDVETGSSDRLPDDHPLVKALAAQKAKNKELTAKASKLDELENAQKSELQRALERAEEAEGRANSIQFELMRSRVAAAKGVPAESLTGANEDELNAAADSLIAWRGKAEQPISKAASGQLRSGATGNGGGTADPKERAANAIRQLFDR